MSEAPIRSSEIARKVLCPDCGASLSARGLQGHRRLSHGVVADRSAGGEPGSLVRAPQSEQTVDYLPPLVRALDELLAILRRLETRLDRLEAAPNGSAAPAESPRHKDARVIEESLRSVLGEIARLQNQWRAIGAARGVKPFSVADNALEETTYVELGKLRRRQASLLFRLRELQGEDFSDEALCS